MKQSPILVIGRFVPSIIDYPTVLESLERAELRCVYPNSGAFGLPTGTAGHFLGWTSGDDATIRAEVRAIARVVPPPPARSLAALLGRAWQQYLPGPLWLMPASHWAYELRFGAADWLPGLLAEHGVDADLLRSRSDGSAIQFEMDEANSLIVLVENLFGRLIASDFTIAFPDRAVVGMLHHHQQIWWQMSDKRIWESLDDLLRV